MQCRGSVSEKIFVAEVAPKCLKITCDVEETHCLERRLCGPIVKTKRRKGTNRRKEKEEQGVIGVGVTMT